MRCASCGAAVEDGATCSGCYSASPVANEPRTHCCECSREVRATATRCPVCGAKQVAAGSEPVPPPPVVATTPASPPRPSADTSAVRHDAGSRLVFVSMEHVVYPTSCCCCGMADGFNKLEVAYRRRSQGEIGFQFRRPTVSPNAGAVALKALSVAVSAGAGHHVVFRQAQVQPVVAFPACSDCCRHVGMTREVTTLHVLVSMLAGLCTLPLAHRLPSIESGTALTGIVSILAGLAVYAVQNVVRVPLRASCASRFSPAGMVDLGKGQLRFRLENADFRAAFVKSCERAAHGAAPESSGDTVQ